MEAGTRIRVNRYGNVAWWVVGQSEEHEGMLVCRMIGDDMDFIIDPEECEEVDEGDYCGGCGQIGCKAYG